MGGETKPLTDAECLAIVGAMIRPALFSARVRAHAIRYDVPALALAPVGREIALLRAANAALLAERDEARASNTTLVEMHQADMAEVAALLARQEELVRVLGDELDEALDLGVFPAVLVEDGVERKRTEFQSGWNNGYRETCKAAWEWRDAVVSRLREQSK